MKSKIKNGAAALVYPYASFPTQSNKRKGGERVREDETASVGEKRKRDIAFHAKIENRYGKG